MRSVNRRWVIVIILLVLVLGIGYLVLAHRNNQPGKTDFTGTYNDPYSNETVSNPAGKSPDTYGTAANQPVYLGFDKLLNYGIGLDQLNEIKTAFYGYSGGLPKPLTEISVDVDSIQTFIDHSSDAPFSVDFNVVFDRTQHYKAKGQYAGLSDMRLLIMDTAGKTVYDSGKLGGE